MYKERKREYVNHLSVHDKPVVSSRLDTDKRGTKSSINHSGKKVLLCYPVSGEELFNFNICFGKIKMYGN